MENNITLYGASGHAKVIIDILNSNSVIIEAVIDDNPKAQFILEKAIVDTANFDFKDIKNIIISIGNNKVRKSISSRLKLNYVNAIHPSAIISNNVVIGKGTVIMAGAIINPDAKIGTHCIINSGSIIEHDCQIANFSHISPSASLAGNVKIGEGAHIGIGAVIIQGITVGKWSIVGAGAIIINDVPDYAVVVGNPGKIIKYIEKNE